MPPWCTGLLSYQNRHKKGNRCPPIAHLSLWEGGNGQNTYHSMRPLKFEGPRANGRQDVSHKQKNAPTSTTKKAHKPQKLRPHKRHSRQASIDTCSSARNGSGSVSSAQQLLRCVKNNAVTDANTADERSTLAASVCVEVLLNM